MIQLGGVLPAFLVSIVVAIASFAAGQTEQVRDAKQISNQAAMMVDIAVADLVSNKSLRPYIDQLLDRSFGISLDKKLLRSIDRLSLTIAAPKTLGGMPNYDCRLTTKGEGDAILLVNAIFGKVTSRPTESGWTNFSSRRRPVVGRYKSTALEIGTRSDADAAEKFLVSEKLKVAFTQLDQSATVRIAIDAQAIAAAESTVEGSRFLRDDALQKMFDWGEYIGQSSMALYANASLGEISTITLAADLNKTEIARFRVVAVDGKSELVNAKAALIFDFMVSTLELQIDLLKTQQVKMVETLEELKAGIKLTKSDKDFVVSFAAPTDFADKLVAFLTGMNTLVAERRDRQKIQEMSFAAHNFHDFNDQFPFHFDSDSEFDKDLSWRVKLLEHVERRSISARMELSKSWDAKENRFAIERGDDLFTISTGNMFCAIDTDPYPKNLRSILDGSTNTLMLIENPRSTMTPWTKPDDLTIDEAVELVKNIKPGKFLWAAMFDGRVVKIPSLHDKKIPDRMIRNLFDPDDGDSTEKLFEVIEEFNSNGRKSRRFGDRMLKRDALRAFDDIARDLERARVDADDDPSDGESVNGKGVGVKEEDKSDENEAVEKKEELKKDDCHENEIDDPN